MAVDYRNWIADQNPHKLKKPPMWFLKMLYDQDAALVILPSRTGRAYLMARRREFSMRVPLMVQAHNTLMRQTRGLDGDMLATHNLQGVNYLTGNVYGTWSPGIIQQLKDRDIWAAGGADKYIANIEEAEAKEVRNKRKQLLDNIEHRAGDAWRSYTARTGQRNQHSNFTHKKATKVKMLRTKLSPQPSSSTEQSGFSVDVGFTGPRLNIG
jgi:hypothetical protein